MHACLITNKQIGKNLVEFVCPCLEYSQELPDIKISYKSKSILLLDIVIKNPDHAFEEQLLILKLLNHEILRKLILTTTDGRNRKDLRIGRTSSEIYKV